VRVRRSCCHIPFSAVGSLWSVVQRLLLKAGLRSVTLRPTLSGGLPFSETHIKLGSPCFNAMYMPLREPMASGCCGAFSEY
jgi:hypothetical protein